MRIAYLSQSYPPMISGASIFSEQLAKEMVKRGHQVLVLCASDKNLAYSELKRNLTIQRLPSYHNPMRVGQRFMFYPRRAIMKTLHDFRPHIIHSHDPLQIGLIGLEYANKAHIPSSITLHQLPWFAASYLPGKAGPMVESILWIYARWLLNKISAIIVPTETISVYIKARTGLESKVIGYGVNCDDYGHALAPELEISLRQKLDIPLAVPIILHVGRLDMDKRVDLVIQSAARTFQTSNAHLLVVGDGQQKVHLIQLSKNLGISDRVHFPGYILSEQGLPDIYRMSYLFITASQIETQGIVLLEAAASGLPLVAVHATCIPELVHHGINGYLAEPGDIQALSNSMNKLIMDPEMSAEMGRKSRLLVKNHSHQISLDAHEELYRQLKRGFFSPQKNIGVGSRKKPSLKTGTRSG